MHGSKPAPLKPGINVKRQSWREEKVTEELHGDQTKGEERTYPCWNARHKHRTAEATAVLEQELSPGITNPASINSGQTK